MPSVGISDAKNGRSLLSTLTLVKKNWSPVSRDIYYYIELEKIKK